MDTINDPGYQCESDKLTVGHHKREPRGQLALSQQVTTIPTHKGLFIIMKYSVIEPDQLASYEAGWSGSTLFQLFWKKYMNVACAPIKLIMVSSSAFCINEEKI